MNLTRVRLGDIRFVRYLLASAGALAVDVGTFLALLSGGAQAVPASVAGYVLGIVAHWLLSSRAVFVANVAVGGAARNWQKGLFVLSALIGLGLTTTIVAIAESLALDPRLAKLVAIGVSFLATWLLRSQIVFSRRIAG